MDFTNNNSFENKAIRKQARYGQKAAEFLKESENARIESEKTQEKAKLDTLKENMNFTIASSQGRSRNRIQNAKNEMEYIGKSSLYGVNEFISRLTEESLLLDEEEFSKLNPSYKEEIRALVQNILENADLSSRITNKDTNLILEEIFKGLPMAKTGKYLTEDEIKDNFINHLMDKEEVKKSIDSLSKDVQNKVVNLVRKENERAEEIQKDFDKINKVKNSFATDNTLVPGVPEEQTDDSVLDPNFAAHAEAGEIEGLDESDMFSKIGDTIYVNEPKVLGLLESFAINEGKMMISEGRKYNRDLAIANSVMYITILEALNVSGIIELTENDMNKLIIKNNNSIKEPLIRNPLKNSSELNESSSIADRLAAKIHAREAKQAQLNESAPVVEEKPMSLIERIKARGNTNK